MFNENNEEKKLDWMYKGANSLVDREEYLLGRSVDKTLEQLNDEDKQKQQGLIVPPKNRVEHECIPPSIRDFNKVVQAEQVDLSAKLQEDPLVEIKKREEESRRQFLQNPVQLKKLQKALKAQQAKNKKKKKKKKKKKSKQSDDDSDSDLDAKLIEKLLQKKDKKMSKEERDLDTILIHKYEEFKDKLTETDIQDILSGKITDSSSSEEDEEQFRKKSRKKRRQSSDSDDSSEEDKRKRKTSKKLREGGKSNFRQASYKYSDRNEYRRREKYIKHEHEPEKYKPKDKNHYPKTRDDKRDQYSHKEYQQNEKHRAANVSTKSRDYSSSSSSEQERRKYVSDDSDSDKKKKINYGLVSSDGKKIRLGKNDPKKEEIRSKPKAPEPPSTVHRHRAKKLTDEEKEKLRQQMMQNAVKRDKERSRTVKKYRETEEKERREQDFDPEFIHKQLLKSSQTSSVESRIKSNLNNIQRSSRAMDRNFSRR